MWSTQSVAPGYGVQLPRSTTNVAASVPPPGKAEPRTTLTPYCVNCGLRIASRWGGSFIHQVTAAFGV